MLRTLRQTPRLVRKYAVDFKNRPSPMPLPKEEQQEFERLQREAVNQPNQTMYYKPYADFEGEKNPETGEIGGPKQDPLRHGDYSFNGKVTDF